MQRTLANWTANILSDHLHSKVEIGSVNLGFLNRIIINDVAIYEPEGPKIASIARMSASINLFSLLTDQINIGTAQLFGVKATLYKDTPDSKPNFQFIIDALSQEEKKEPKPLDMRVGSFIMRHADVTWDIKSEVLHPGKLEPTHLNLRDCGINMILRALTDDSINVDIRRMQAKELHSGLSIHDTKLKLIANHQKATLSDFDISLSHSHISFDTLSVDYGLYEKRKAFVLHSTPIQGIITPSDLAFVSSQLAHIHTQIELNVHAEGNEKKIEIKDLQLSTEDNSIRLRAIAQIENPLDKERRHLHTQIQTLHISNDEMHTWVTAFAPQEKDSHLLELTRELRFQGMVDYDADGMVESNGDIITDVGKASYDLSYDKTHLLSGTLEGDSINIGKLVNDETIGTTSFHLDFAINTSQLKPFPTGRVEGDVHSLYYKGYKYQNIRLEARSNTQEMEGTASIDDENIKADATFALTDAPAKGIDLNLLLSEFRPHALHLINNHENENLTMNINVNLHGQDFNHLYGEAVLEDVNLMTPEERFHLKGFAFHAEKLNDGESRYTVNSDFLSGNIQGQTSLADISNSFIHQMSHHLPIIFKSKGDHHAMEKAKFSYDLTITDHPILHHFTEADFSIDKPLRIFGDLDASIEKMSFQLDAPLITYNGEPYNDIAVACNSTSDNMNVHAIASTSKESTEDDEPNMNARVDVMADVHQNKIVSDLYINTTGRNNVMIQLLPIVQLSDSLGSTKTSITLRKSNALINDTTWTISPANITLYKESIECHHVKLSNNNVNSYLAIDGKASNLPTDSLVASLNNLEIKYFLSLANFNVVRFAGKASGRAVVNNVMGAGVPDVRADLTVKNLTIQEGSLGDAHITAHWDKTIDGISLDGRMVDLYKAQDGLSGRERNVTGITTVKGWVSPAKNDMRLNVNTHNTNASFIHGFLKSVFKEISGSITGPIQIVGPFNNVNILADAVPNMNMRLRATNVPYHIEGDTIRMRNHLFDFSNINIYDRFGNQSLLNGRVTHRNMKNFSYHFQVDLHQLLAYDEKNFNSDKFLATVFADGNLTIDGSDGHPLYVNASVTPTQGSVFAYDAATPDAITGSSFIEFRDRDSLLTFNPKALQYEMDDDQPVEKDSLTIVNEARKNYSSDIFINFDINLTPDCEVKLRMDNLEDGYMRTFGNAKLTARWYNKGTFQMFGNYSINSGSYRLYLQDIIFRDLTIQPGSLVEFNGNPFDANIHLICHHTINSVPLSDLTSTTAFSQNNKAKVICILDITGKLGNMDFKFDMDMPHVNEATRQLVKSMINSEEEMNTQMIYLLGLGRFYPNEYARANGNGNSGQAMNSLLSSTLSGQINQMLSNVVGKESNWNIGSSLTTGEKGWDDLDVEGTLEGHLMNERLLINGAFGYRDNAMTNRSSFVGDFEVKWRLSRQGNIYVKAYNLTNDRYFTKATLNTQGVGLSWRHDFESIRRRMKKREKEKKENEVVKKTIE